MSIHSQKTETPANANRPLKWYAVIVTVIMLLVLAAFIIVFTRAGYHTKLLVRLGLQEPVAKTNHALLAWENCLTKLDYDADAVFFGDSITYESNFSAADPQYKIVNLGYSGDTLHGMISRVPMVQAVSPEKVFVLGGINGLNDSNIDQTAAQYEKLLNELHRALPDAEIYIQSVLPIAKEREVSLTNICHNETIIAFNQRLQSIAEARNLTYIDIHALYYQNGQIDPSLTYDGLHLLSHAYQLWEDAVTPYLN